jgi:hypothetical protein
MGPLTDVDQGGRAMSPGSHAAGDGSFARSSGIQVGRAALLIAVAVVIGLILLRRTGGGVPAPVGTNTPTTVGTIPTTGGTSLGGGPATTTRGGTTTPTAALRAPTDIKVLVANGTSTPGLAGKVSNQLHAKGYVTLASVNSTQKPASTIVYFAAGYSGDAIALAGKLSLPSTAVQAMPVPPPVPSLNGANILVVVGPDLANVSTTSTT